MKNCLAILVCVLLVASPAMAREFEITSATMHSNGTVIEFSGEVHIADEKLNLYADLLSLDTATNIYDIRGTPATVEFSSAAGTTSVIAATIGYDSTKHQARISGGGRIVHGELELRAMSMVYDELAASMTADQDVSVNEGSYAATGTLAQIRNLTGNKILIIEGMPATFNAAHGDTELQAQANRIEYDHGTDSVLLAGNATAKYGSEYLSGEAITYNLRRGTFTAAPSSGERVTIIINLP